MDTFASLEVPFFKNCMQLWEQHEPSTKHCSESFQSTRHSFKAQQVITYKQQKSTAAKEPYVVNENFIIWHQ